MSTLRRFTPHWWWCVICVFGCFLKAWSNILFYVIAKTVATYSYSTHTLRKWPKTYTRAYENTLDVSFIKIYDIRIIEMLLCAGWHSLRLSIIVDVLKTISNEIEHGANQLCRQTVTHTQHTQSGKILSTSSVSTHQSFKFRILHFVVLYKIGDDFICALLASYDGIAFKLNVPFKWDEMRENK